MKYNRVIVFVLLISFCLTSFPLNMTEGKSLLYSEVKNEPINILKAPPYPYNDIEEIDTSYDKSLDNNKNYEKNIERLTNTGQPSYSIQSYSVQSYSYAKAPAVSDGLTHKVIMIPVSFSDVTIPAIYDKTYYEGQMDTLRQYYEENSGYDGSTKGITLDITVTTEVALTSTMAYYGDTSVIDRSAQMTADAVAQLEASGFDFSEFDLDYDGFVDHVIIVHAGEGEEMTGNNNDIWSHKWVIQNNTPFYDNVYIYSYLTVPFHAKLGVTAHEFGHSLGLPDLYDYDGFTNGYTYTLGNWALMDMGAYNGSGASPANLSAFSKYLLGWVEPEVVHSNQEIELINNDGHSNVYMVGINGGQTDDEFYLIEYRRKLGYDSELPGEGVLIYHIDINGMRIKNYTALNNDKSRLLVELEQADGNWDLWLNNNYGDSTDPFGVSNHHFSFVPHKFNYTNMYGSYVGTADESLYDVYNDVDILNIFLGETTASAMVYIDQPELLEKPVVLAPTTNSIYSDGQIFSWEIVPLATDYIFQLATNYEMTQNLVEVSLRDQSADFTYNGNYFNYTLPSSIDIEDHQQYFWRVTGKNDHVNIAALKWSDTYTFRKALQTSFSFTDSNEGILTGYTSDMAISLNGGAEYTSYDSSPLAINADNIDPDFDIYINYLASEHWQQTTPQTIDILEDTTVPADFMVTGDGIEFKINNTGLWQTANDANIIKINNGQSIALKNKNTGTTKYTQNIGFTYSENITPGYITYTIGGDNHQKLMNATKRMVYSTDGGITYVACESDNPVITSFDQGTGILVKYKETPYWNESNSVQVSVYEALTITPGYLSFAVDGDNSYKIMGSTTKMAFSTDGGVHYEPIIVDDVLLDETDLSETKDLRVQYQTLDGVSPANTILFDLTRWPMTDLYIDSSDVIYSTDSGVTWVDYTGSALDTLEHNDPVSLRRKGQGLTLPSISNDLICKKDIMQDTIIYSFDGSHPNLLVGSNEHMTYSLDGQSTNHLVLNNDQYITPESITTTYGIDIKYRDNIYWNSINSINIAFYDGSSESLINPVIDETLEYSSDSGLTWQSFEAGQIEPNDGAAIMIRKKATETTFAGVATANIFNSSIDETLSFSLSGDDANKIMGTTTQMAYSIDGGANYVNISETNQALTQGVLDELNAVDDILVRYQATNIFVAGAYYRIDLLQSEAPAVILSSSYEVLGMTADMAYKLNDGIWTVYSGSAIILAEGDTIDIKYVANLNTLESEVATLSRPKPATPSLGGGGGGGFASIEVVSDEPEFLDEGVKILSDEDIENDEPTTIVIKEDEPIALPLEMMSSDEDAPIIEVQSDAVSLKLPRLLIASSLVEEDAEQYFVMTIKKAELDEGQGSASENIKQLKPIENQVYDFKAKIQQESKTQLVSHFNQPIMGAIDLSAIDLTQVNPHKLGLYYLNEANNSWEYVGGLYDEETKTLSFKLEHFSYYSLMENQVAFADMTSHWAMEDVSEMASKHIAKGRGYGIFDPDTTITRAEFTALMTRLVQRFSPVVDEKNKQGAPYQDIAEAWYTEEIQMSYMLGLTTNLGDMTYYPNRAMTREEMAQMIRNVMVEQLNITEGGIVSSELLLPYLDQVDIDPLYKESVAFSVANGIIKGRSNQELAPKGYATRAESLVMIKRLLKYMIY